MEDIKIKNEELVKVVNEALPKLLADKFKSSYDNPLSDVIDEILKSDEMKQELIRYLLKRPLLRISLNRYNEG